MELEYMIEESIGVILLLVLVGGGISVISLIAVLVTSSKVSKIQAALDEFVKALAEAGKEQEKEMKALVEAEEEKSKKLWDEQAVVLNKQKLLLEEQNLTIIRMLNRMEEIAKK
ncbi:MAG: hypothetical protein FWG66_12795 [Spirochaetes bacterium]|nr:hypothetical protein [Spirochaetota bacterium]